MDVGPLGCAWKSKSAKRSRHDGAVKMSSRRTWENTTRSEGMVDIVKKRRLDIKGECMCFCSSMTNDGVSRLAAGGVSAGLSPQSLQCPTNEVHLGHDVLLVRPGLEIGVGRVGS